mgnify:CR=1 FL=1
MWINGIQFFLKLLKKRIRGPFLVAPFAHGIKNGNQRDSYSFKPELSVL